MVTRADVCCCGGGGGEAGWRSVYSGRIDHPAASHQQQWPGVTAASHTRPSLEACTIQKGRKINSVYLSSNVRVIFSL